MNKMIRSGFLTAWSMLFPTLCPTCSAAALQHFLDKVDSVVVGEVSHGTVVNGSYSLTLMVHRVLKGDLKAGVAIPVRYEATSIPMRGSGQAEYGYFGMWFLASDKGGGWRLIPPLAVQPLPLQFVYYPLPKTTPEQLWDPERSLLVERLFVELAYAVDSVERDQTFHVKGVVPDPTFKHLAEGALQCIDTPSGTGFKGTLDRWSRSSLPNLSTLGITGLIRLGDPAALGRSLAMFPTIKQSQIRGRFVGAVGGYRDSSAEGLLVLGDMATRESEIEGLQAEAAYALRSIHTREALPYLAKLLDSRDAELRQQGVVGFSSFVTNWKGETPGTLNSTTSTKPTNAPFRTADTDRYTTLGGFDRPGDEEPYVTFWKAWWVQHEPELRKPQ